MTSHNVIVTFLSDETAPDEYGGISFYAQPSNYHVLGDDDGEKHSYYVERRKPLH